MLYSVVPMACGQILEQGPKKFPRSCIHKTNMSFLIIISTMALIYEVPIFPNEDLTIKSL